MPRNNRNENKDLTINSEVTFFCWKFYMAFFEWKGEYSVHIKQIDNEHKKIIIHRIKSQQSIM